MKNRVTPEAGAINEIDIRTTMLMIKAVILLGMYST